MTRRLRAILPLVSLVVAALLAHGCDDPTGPRPPEPGLLRVLLEAPDASAALRARVVMPAGLLRGSPIGASGLELHTRSSGDTLFVLAFGDVVAGPVLTLDVTDVAALAQLRPTLIELADGDGALRESLAGYALRVQR